MAAETTSDAVRARATLDFELLEARSDFFDNCENKWTR